MSNLQSQQFGPIQESLFGPGVPMASLSKPQAPADPAPRRPLTATEALRTGQHAMLMPAGLLQQMNPLPGDIEWRTAQEDERDYGLQHVVNNDSSYHLREENGGLDKMWRTETTPEFWSRKLGETQIPKITSAEHALRSSLGKDRLSLPASLYDKIKQNGVQQPVNLFHGDTGPVYDAWSWDMTGRRGNPDLPTIAQGHHRVAAAADLNPRTEVPVMHFGEDSFPGVDPLLKLEYAAHPEHDADYAQRWGLDASGHSTRVPNPDRAADIKGRLNVTPNNPLTSKETDALVKYLTEGQ